MLCYALRIADCGMVNGKFRINFDSFACTLAGLVGNLLKMGQKMHHQLYIYTHQHSVNGFRLRPLVEHFHWLRNEVNLHRISFFIQNIFCFVFTNVFVSSHLYLFNNTILFSKRMPMHGIKQHKKQICGRTPHFARTKKRKNIILQ